MNDPTCSAVPDCDDARLSELVDEMAALWQAGELNDPEEFIRQHADYSSSLRRLLPTVKVLAELHDATADRPGGDKLNAAEQGGLAAATTLGDFQIVREIGRGGMGVVYEAMQLSLGRKVALKVLPFASALDNRHLQRFKNEAQAAAHLHHTHIVPVFAVGSERGVHYYAMQFIDGQPLAAVIADLKQLREPGDPARDGTTAAGSPLLATLRATDGRGKYRWAVRLGIQAAEALDYAHHLGVVHRDIKPGNILIDSSGHPWIADFGLARVQSDANLTMTGDILGTLRYMSPEQALGRRELIDHRTDVYSLGATLFEMLTLAAVYEGADRQALLRQIANDEPRLLRQLEAGAPPELETILIKALGKEPADRYATAQELADDLRRFLNDEPIRARRPSVWQRVVKWSRRHRSLVWTAATCLAMTVTIVAATLGWAIRDHAARETATKREMEDALTEAREHLRAGHWMAAEGAARRASGHAATGGERDADHLAIDALFADLNLVSKLETARLSRAEGANLGEGHEVLDFERTDMAYGHTFVSAGLDFEQWSPEQSRLRLADSPIRDAIAMALDDWALVRLARKPTSDTAWQRLLAIAGALDPDVTRLAVRKAVSARERNALRQYADAATAAELPPQTALLLAGALMEMGDENQSIAVLKRVCARHPGDFWLNFMLGWYYSHRLRNEGQALPYAAAAVSLRPELPAPRASLAWILIAISRPEDAIVECQEALRIKPDFASAHLFLSRAYTNLDRLDDAIAACEKAIELEPKNIVTQHWYANTLRKCGRLDDAVRVLKGTIQADPQRPVGHSWLAFTYLDQGRWVEAALSFEETLRLDPTHRGAHDGLSRALIQLGQFEEAEAARREAVRLVPYDREAHGRLATILAVRGKWRESWRVLNEALEVWLAAGKFYTMRGEFFTRTRRDEFALADFRRALRERPGDPEITLRMAATLQRLGRPEEARKAYRAGLRPQPSLHEYHVKYGVLLRDLGRIDESVAALAEAHRIIPTSRGAQSQYGYSLCRQGKFEAGIEHLKKVLARDPEHALAKELMAQAIAEAKQGRAAPISKPAESSR